MTLIDKLFTHKRQEKQVIWGIRVPKNVKSRWQILATFMRVPTNRLILFILNNWVQQNAKILVNREDRNQLADKIIEVYFKGKLN